MQWPSRTTITVADYEFLIDSGTLFVTVITPLDGSTATDANVPVQWSFNPGTQANYRVRVWSDSAKTNLVYDSGVVANGTMAAAIPEGALVSGQEYYLLVNITTTSPQAGESALIHFTSAFQPSVAVTGVTVMAIGDVCEHNNPPILPGIRIDWDQVVPDATESFVRYSVWRSPDGATWTRIASITDISTTTYVDYNVAGRQGWAYAVTWTAIDTAAGTLVSPRQNPPLNGHVDFDWAFLHDVFDPSFFVWFPSFDISIDLQQSIEYVRLWHRQQPTAFLDADQAHTFRIGGLSTPYRDTVWESLVALITRQRTVGSILCLRSGVAAERYFVTVSASSRRDQERTITPNISLTETHYAEALE